MSTAVASIRAGVALRTRVEVPESSRVLKCSARHGLTKASHATARHPCTRVFANQRRKYNRYYGVKHGRDDIRLPRSYTEFYSAKDLGWAGLKLLGFLGSSALLALGASTLTVMDKTEQVCVSKSSFELVIVASGIIFTATYNGLLPFVFDIVQVFDLGRMGLPFLDRAWDIVSMTIQERRRLRRNITIFLCIIGGVMATTAFSAWALDLLAPEFLGLFWP